MEAADPRCLGGGWASVVLKPLGWFPYVANIENHWSRGTNTSHFPKVSQPPYLHCLLPSLQQPSRIDTTGTQSFIHNSGIQEALRKESLSINLQKFMSRLKTLTEPMQGYLRSLLIGQNMTIRTLPRRNHHVFVSRLLSLPLRRGFRKYSMDLTF